MNNVERKIKFYSIYIGIEGVLYVLCVYFNKIDSTIILFITSCFFVILCVWLFFTYNYLSNFRTFRQIQHNIDADYHFWIGTWFLLVCISLVQTISCWIYISSYRYLLVYTTLYMINIVLPFMCMLYYKPVVNFHTRTLYSLHLQRETQFQRIPNL